MTIQWFPGHMAKARREVEENLNVVDLVIELVDARSPIASQNPMLQDITKQKTKVILLMKKDLADPKVTEQWIRYFVKQGHSSMAVNVNDTSDIKKVIQLVKEVGSDRLKKLMDKGVNPRPLRAMIIGIPNVGKSSLINRLANRKVARIGDRPGVTKHQSWIKVRNEFDLLDTPGILWPKFDDQEVGYRLAAIGTIKDSILSLQDIAAYVIKYLQEYYEDLLEERLGIDADMYDMWDVFERIGKRHGALESGGHVNFDKVANIVLGDLRSGRLGRISLERAEG
ncbi:ribosome biogenesis GTPase YlqF [Ornithinibacillus sp. 4-3]|uniref:Ribosome biogenesis GTPase A n=1 Tax=Ornithinibacillus sp. 4-3 TaxID=3231488 RepID=A0AB39HRS8_9BACI